MNMAIRFDDRWGLAADSDRRFRRCCMLVLPAVMALMVLLPRGPWPRAVHEEEPLRVQLLPPPPPPPPPTPPAPRVEPPPPTPQLAKVPAMAKPKPAAPTTPSPRALAEAAGMAQLRSQLAALQADSPAAIGDTQRLLQQEPAATPGSGNTGHVAAAAMRGSAGIGHGERGLALAQAAAGPGARRTGAVHSTLAGKADAPSSDDAQGNGGRSLQELQLAFDRSKSSFFSIFDRAARERADIGAGRIVVSLTIAPDGSVTRCELVSSSFGDGALEQKILQRVKLLNFGAKNVPAYTYPNYPIQFLPS